MNPDFPDNLRLGGGETSSLLHPIALVALLITVILTFFLPRKYVIVPLLFFTFLTPSYQQIYFIGLHLFLGRILILCGWIRMFWTKMAKAKDGIPGGLNEIDKLFIVWALVRATASIGTTISTGCAAPLPAIWMSTRTATGRLVFGVPLLVVSQVSCHWAPS